MRSLGQTFANAAVQGVVTSPDLTEISGLVASRQNPGVLWTHNDGGFGATVFALSTNAIPLGRYYVPGAPGGANYEDIAIGPGSDPAHQYIYLGDIGDDFLNRSFVRVIRFPEPAVYLPQSNAPPVLPVVGAQIIQLQYPDGPFDAEALMVDPLTGDLFIATKATNSARLYRATRAQLDGGGPVVMTFIREMVFSGFRSVSAGDISWDGRLILMRRNGRAWAWNRVPTSSVGDTLAASGVTAPVATSPPDLNGEAIAAHAAGQGYYTLSEGTPSTNNFFRRTDGGTPRAPVVFIPAGEVWRYQDLGTDEGTAWRQPGFDDSTWLPGRAQLGYGQGDEQTELYYGPDPFAKIITTYFRKQFIRPTSVVWTNVALRLCFTDGVAVYLNGVEIFRRNIDAGATYQIPAFASQAVRQNIWTSVPVSLSLLVSGVNVVAVELHRQAPDDPDLSFDLQLVEGFVDLPARFTSLPRLVGGMWRMDLAGPVGSLARIEASGDLQFWTEAGRVVLTNGTGQFQEAVSGSWNNRFYRLPR